MYMYMYLNPTAVTEDVGVSEPVNVSLMTSGGCRARLNMTALTTRRQMVCSTQHPGANKTHIPTAVHSIEQSYMYDTLCSLCC